MRELEKQIEQLEIEIKNPNTPQGKINEYKNNLYTLRSKLKRLKEDEFTKINKTNLYFSDDYAGCSAGEYEFYYGYEVTKCPIKSHKNDDDCYEKNCEKREWCFQVSKDNKDIVTWTASEISYLNGDVLEMLIWGMCKFIKENLTTPPVIK